MKKYIAGIITGILLMSTTIAFAETYATINVFFDRVKLVVNGELTDTPTMLYDGRTYIQLAGAAEAFGADLRWDGTTSTAYLTNNSGLTATGPSQKFRHIVVWDFKEGLSEEEKDTLFNTMKEDLENLTNVIDGIVKLYLVRDVLNPGINGEGQLVLNSWFESEQAYEAYAVHPAHLEIAAYVRSDIVENRRVVNFLEPEATKHRDIFHHIVIWDFKDGLSEDEKHALFSKMKEDLEDMVNIIPGLLEMRIERDHYNTDGNGQLVLYGLFDCKETYAEIYAPHPRHLEIAAYVVADIVQNRRAANFYQ